MAGYLGAIPVPQATQNRESFTASADQTSFATAGYTVGFVDAFLNGVRLNTADFTATNGSDIVLAAGAAVNDILDVISYATFEINAQTFTGTTTLTDVVAASLDISGNIDIDGITNLDVVDIDGAVNIAAATTIATNNKIQFRDTAIYLNSSADGQLDIVADTEIQIAATTIDIDGAVALNGAITGATNITLSGELDAATLDISGNVDFAGVSTFADGSASAPSITNTGDVDTGIYFPAANQFGIATGGSSRLIVDDNGRVDIGGGGSSAIFDVKSSQTGDWAGRFENTSATGFGVLAITAGNSRTQKLIEARRSTTTNVFQAFGDGNVLINDGNLEVAAGHGIDFSAQTSANAVSGVNTTAELLDHYEEGTWTPTVAGADTAGSVSYTARTGSYTRIGRLVHIDLVLAYSISSEAGTLLITGLPFTSAAESVGTFQCNDMELAYQDDVGQYSARLAYNVTTVTIRGTRTNGGATEEMVAQSLAYLRVSMQYNTH